MNKLKIRDRIVASMSLMFAVLMGIAFISIYYLTEHHRSQVFYQRIKDRTTTTLKLLIEVKEIDTDILQTFDRNTINNLYDEKILIFDQDKKLIYSSIDDEQVPYSESIFNNLVGDETYIESTEGKYEVVGIEFKHDGKIYYGIAKAYDKFGKRKVAYLGNVLIVTYIISFIIVSVIAFLLARRITQPIQKLTKELEKISIDNLSTKVDLEVGEDEMGFLTQKFNELLIRLETAFAFQKNFIHHISHELKTPLAIMLTNAERSLAEDSPEQWKESLEFQRSTTKELAHIINVLIDISKVDMNKDIQMSEPVRIDELIFECIDEIGYLNPSVNFTCTINPQIENDDQLIIQGNKRMLKLAYLNLLKNAINYSKKEKAFIEILTVGDYIQVYIENDGLVIEEVDRHNLFISIFRGRNAQTKKGLGLGLFLTNKIINIHKGEIYYNISKSGTNVFMVRIPLSQS